MAPDTEKELAEKLAKALKELEQQPLRPSHSARLAQARQQALMARRISQPVSRFKSQPQLTTKSRSGWVLQMAGVAMAVALVLPLAHMEPVQSINPNAAHSEEIDWDKSQTPSVIELDNTEPDRLNPSEQAEPIESHIEKEVVPESKGQST